MNRWNIILTTLAIYGGVLCFCHGRWSTKSKYFKLYKFLIDPRKCPDLSITVTEGEFPAGTMLCIVTYLPSRIASKQGVKSHQIVGTLMSFRQGFVAKNFSGNRAFKEMIHAIAAKQ